MADDTIEIEYQLTVDDLLAFNLFVCKRKQYECAFCNPLKLLIFVIIFGALCSLAIFEEFPHLLFVFIGMFVGVGILTLLNVYTFENSTRKMYNAKENQNIHTFMKKTLEITSNSVQERTEVSEATYKWPTVQSVEKNQDYIFVFLSSVIASIVPRRAFETEEQYENFYQKCVEYQEAAQGETVDA